MLPKKILICDDDESILDSLSMVLESLDYKVTTVLHSTRAMKLIVSEKPDLILLDLWMPVLNGEDLFKEIKSNKALKKIPVIMMSAGRDGLKIAEDLQAEGYAPKPFEFSYLEKLIHELLGRH